MTTLGDTGRPTDASLAVDFGTSHTVAVLRTADGRTRTLLFDGSPLLPSAVYAAADGELYTGRDAIHQARLDPASFEPHPKRRIDDHTVLLGRREIPVVQLLTAVLRRVATEAERTAGALPPVVLTHPAAWGGTRRAILEQAAAGAGMTASLVAEPVAAAAYFTTVLGNALPVGRTVAVFDFGGGTLDVAVVCREANSGLSVIGSGGLDDLGGLDIDAAIVEHLGRLVAPREPDLWRQLTHPGTSEALRNRRLLWEDARSAKEILTRSSSAAIHIAGYAEGAHLTRAELETIATPLLARGVDAAARLLRDCGLAPTDLAGLFLVGGSSRVPLVAQLLHRELGIAPTVLEQPELAVAEGALQAAGMPPPVTARSVVAVPPATTATVVLPALTPAGPGPRTPVHRDTPNRDAPNRDAPIRRDIRPVSRQWRWPVIAAALTAVVVLVGVAAYVVVSPLVNAASESGDTPPSEDPSAPPESGEPAGQPMTRPDELADDPHLRDFTSGWAPTHFRSRTWKYCKAPAVARYLIDGRRPNHPQNVFRDPSETISCHTSDLLVSFAIFRDDRDFQTAWTEYTKVSSAAPVPGEPTARKLPWGTGERAIIWKGAHRTIGVIVTTYPQVDLASVVTDGATT